ncbi:LCP family protein [Brevibacillus invocatus]|uniref:LytR family transcriptional regulator n=1 Tax=Brevibacillus invocatus TaxID=173959 RepID=A0A3M8BY27_9BACL|nr:LCP family protein [Brevibacillus invocatus]MCM3079528.1 LCP family protein [Brevibacillus invocatus]MCM3429727.1 LCP family protein [Brevibacillus invocatus]RNB68311.1 LytR family transcriptional regulator [Brevibacillus invocatus]
MRQATTKTRASAARTKKTGRSRKIRRWIFALSLFTLLLVGGVAGAVYWKIDDALNTVTKPNDNFSSPVSQVTNTSYEPSKPMSFVILGSDNRVETGSMNTDVMIVAVANPETKKVTMVSIPRDTRVKIPGYRDYHKINSVFANGEAERRKAERNNQIPTEDGISLTKKTLNEILGIPIDHYVAIDFDGFKAVIDELGGVEVNVDRKLVYDDPTDDTHINLSPGLQILNGEQALGYVRHRHDNRGTKYYSSDFDRNRRQQEVIKAIVDKAGSLEGLTKVFTVMDVGAKHIHTDFSKDQIKGLAYDFKGFNSSTVTTLENGAYWSGGYTYLEKDKLESVRSSLQAEMGVSGSIVAQMNNSPILGKSEEAVAASSSNSSKKSTTKTQAASKPKNTTEEPKEEAPPTPPAAPEDSDENQVAPPDVDVPEQQEEYVPEGQTPPAQTEPSPTPGNVLPPPDIISPVGQDVTQIPAPNQPNTQTDTRF